MNFDAIGAGLVEFNDIEYVPDNSSNKNEFENEIHLNVILVKYFAVMVIIIHIIVHHTVCLSLMFAIFVLVVQYYLMVLHQEHDGDHCVRNLFKHGIASIHGRHDASDHELHMKNNKNGNEAHYNILQRHVAVIIKIIKIH